MKSVKQVIIWRKDLKVRKGKMMAQAAHASLGALLKQPLALIWYLLCRAVGVKLNRTPLHIWLSTRFTKICVSCENEDELIKLYEKAKDANIPTALITDAGFTEFKGVPTNTCIGIGPYWSEDIDKISGGLPLL